MDLQDHVIARYCSSSCLPGTRNRLIWMQFRGCWAELDSCGYALGIYPIRQYQQENAENMLAASKIRVSIIAQTPLSVEHWAFGNHSTLLLAGLIVSGFLPHRHHTFSLSRMAVPSLAQRTTFQICGDSLMLEVGFGRLQGCLHSVA